MKTSLLPYVSTTFDLGPQRCGCLAMEQGPEVDYGAGTTTFPKGNGMEGCIRLGEFEMGLNTFCRRPAVLEDWPSLGTKTEEGALADSHVDSALVLRITSKSSTKSYQASGGRCSGEKGPRRDHLGH